MTVRKRLSRSNVYMFLVPLLTAALLLLLGAGIALYVLETKYLPRLGLSLQEMHMTLEQYETTFQSFEMFIWIYLGTVGMALLLTICFTNLYLTRSLFRRISEPLDTLVAGVERIQAGDLDSPISYQEEDEFKAACDAVDLMAAKLRAALDAEQRRQQSRKELIAGMSHDLKSPLTSIRAYSEAIRDGVASSDAMRQRYIETVCRKEQEIEDMVNRIFEFSKLDLSETPLDMQPLNAAVELRSAAADMADRADRADICVDIPQETLVLADRAQLQRIAKNVFDNSVKYGGRKRIGIRVTAQEEDGLVTLRFADNGQGVDDDKLPKLFDVFYRADPSRDRGRDGSGIGLAVVRKSAEEMGGSACAERGPEGGLCIAVVLKSGSETHK